MDKSNIFKSSPFFLNNGDILNIRIIDESGATVDIDMREVVPPGTALNVVPGQVVAKDATSITASSFSANWNFMENTTGYYLDVATDSAFTSFVAGYENKDVGNVNTDSVTGLSPDVAYYYRIRGVNSIGVGLDSQTIEAITTYTANDYFLPSIDELNAMYTELYLYGVGGFIDSNHWSSTEYDATRAWRLNFASGDLLYTSFTKSSNLKVRACRAFTSTTNYNLRDIGQAGGYIFWKMGNNYLECEMPDRVDAKSWSNVSNIAIGTTGSAIGTGQANTTAIIGQVGHTASAAKVCNDLAV